MKRYRCWNHDQESEADAKEIEADNWKDAAMEFARRDFDEESFDEINVRVRTAKGALYELGIEAEQEISFWPGLGFRVEEAEESEEAKRVIP